MSKVHLYAGPSTCGLPPEAIDPRRVLLYPPARRGDIDRLVDASKRPGVIVVCDGVFQSEPAVSHAELCRALDCGWQVWGVSSLGAIRAFELRNEGMRGFGYVYSLFERIEGFADDEVCLLHFPEAPYFPVSEPLVNIRFALECNRVALGITGESEAATIAALRALWFGDRTAARVHRIMVDAGGLDDTVARRLLDWVSRSRVKALDLAGIMTQQPWK